MTRSAAALMPPHEFLESGDAKPREEAKRKVNQPRKDQVNLRLPMALYNRLEEIRQDTFASSATEVLRDAVVLYSALVKEHKNGSEVLVISSDGKKTKYPVFL